MPPIFVICPEQVAEVPPSSGKSRRSVGRRSVGQSVSRSVGQSVSRSVVLQFASPEGGTPATLRRRTIPCAV